MRRFTRTRRAKSAIRTRLIDAWTRAWTWVGGSSQLVARALARWRMRREVDEGVEVDDESAEPFRVTPTARTSQPAEPERAETPAERAAQRRVDRASADSFPASDPPAWTATGTC